MGTNECKSIFQSKARGAKRLNTPPTHTLNYSEFGCEKF